MAGLEWEITTLASVAAARRAARLMAESQGLDRNAVESVSIAVSELGTNLVFHGIEGCIVLATAKKAGFVGVRIESRDRGPGIQDVQRALHDGYSTRGGMGNGLPAVRRLMDDFAVETGPAGTTIVAHKWGAAA